MARFQGYSSIDGAYIDQDFPESDRGERRADTVFLAGERTQYVVLSGPKVEIGHSSLYAPGVA